MTRAGDIGEQTEMAGDAGAAAAYRAEAERARRAASVLREQVSRPAGGRSTPAPGSGQRARRL
ncbi:hypothetical protein [Actinoplanes couchii]|uniref:Uncharacterized protein n=1 Tax=Actinoplanes couchii TaxID=403638 RepID=A0ABQ3XP74_9ACTN|nr:hypothetical protein [Actinoplanes couchii]MDR6315911.1 hypothetical protein [Actinoplanes couchii]GID60291.1 hypothetical protein Aco03nite_086950 [Actinoplanes couchii]